jgi:anti-sigma factor RsiW
MLSPLYLTGELDRARTEELARHLRGCPACASDLGVDKLMRETVLSERVDSAPLERRVHQLIAQESRRVMQRWMFAAAGVAALALIAALGYRAIFKTTPVYAAAARDHHLEIVDHQPRKWFTDRSAIEDLAGKQGFSKLTIAGIAPAGYRLAQAKLCRLDGVVFLHLVYAGETTIFSVFLRQLNPAGGAETSRPIRTGAAGAEYIAGFEDARLSALVVTEESEAAAMRFAKLAAARL